MDNPGVSGSSVYSDLSWRQHGADRTRPEQHNAGSSEESRDLLRDRDVITNYINGPTPLGRLTFDQELNIALRRFRLKVDAHMAEEWEKSRRLRAIAGLNRWNQMMARSRESGVTFTQECTAMMMKVRAKLDIQMAVEKLQLKEKLAAQEGDYTINDAHEGKIKEMNDKMIEDKFEAPMAEVYAFRTVLKELKAKVGKNVADNKLSQDVAAIHKRQIPIAYGLDNRFRAVLKELKEKVGMNEEAAHKEIQRQNGIYNKSEINRYRTGHTNPQKDNIAEKENVERILPQNDGNPLTITDNGQHIQTQESWNHLANAGQYAGDVMKGDDALAGGDGAVVKGPSNGYDGNDGRAASEAIGTYSEKDLADAEIDQDIVHKTGCWTFFSRIFRLFRNKKSKT